MKSPKFFPALLFCLLLLEQPGTGRCSQIEDFAFLNRTLDEAEFVSSREDFFTSYCVFIVSTMVSFEASYWFLELIRHKLHPGSQLSIYTPEIVEIASVWTAGSVTRSSEYSHWPRNKILHYSLKAGGALQAVLAGILWQRGRITVPALIMMFMSAELLAQEVTGTLATLFLKWFNVEPGNMTPDIYDDTELCKSSIGVGLSMGIIAFAVLTLREVSPLKRAVTGTITAVLSATAVKVAFMDISRIDIWPEITAAKDKAGIPAGTLALFIATLSEVTGARTRAGNSVLAAVTAGGGAMSTAAAAATTGVETAILVIAGAGTRVVSIGRYAARTVATLVAVTGALALSVLVKPDPASDTRYSRMAATLAVASLFAFISAIANYLNEGIPLDKTLFAASWLYWEKPYEIIHHLTSPATQTP